ncbi:glycosyltransferase [Pseudenhygromyxa sp. WMMC2535]|nr:glycosyltransferase [Pseudenhygromyxa sp. WMMC2535]
MYKINIDESHSIIEFYLAGLVRNAEIDDFIADLEKATRAFAGRNIKIKADLRAFSPASQDVADKIKAVQQFGIENGVQRVAEIVESDVVALQLNRVARESGTDKILRRFWEDESALYWLKYGDTERVAV